MRRLDLREAEHPGGLCLVGAGGDAIDDRLEWNLGQRECRRAGDEGAGKDVEMRAARHLEHGLERERTAAAEKADETRMPAAAEHGERIQDRRVADDVEDRINPFRM